MKKTYLYILLILTCSFLASCEDSALQNYKHEVIVEAYLYVDKPITQIRIMNTQPIFNKFDYENYYVKNATVIITGEGKSFPLQYDTNKKDGYYSPDTAYLVKPNTKYDIEIKLSDGSTMTGSTTTPGRTEWLRRVNKVLQFPKDTLKLRGTDSISWKSVPNTYFYYAVNKCLDTLNYGKYLNPPTREMNRRTYTLINKSSESNERPEPTVSAILGSNKTSIIWNFFRWFGSQEITIMVVDENMLKWGFQNYSFPQFDNKLNSITGGKGCFGSVFCLSDTLFLLKNQP